MDEAGENEISISWVKSNPLSKRFEKEKDEVECIYAFNNKAISGVPIAGVSAGKKIVLRQTLAEVHEQLQCLLEVAENDYALLQSTCFYGDFNCMVFRGVCGIIWCFVGFMCVV